MNTAIIGTSRCGKTTYILDEITKDLKNGLDKIFLFVPDQFTFETERQLIEKTGGVGLFNVEVLSFRNLVSKLRDELGGKAYEELTEVSKAVYTNKLLYDYNNELLLYKNRFKSPDFAVMLSKIITECKQFGLSSKDIKNLPVENEKLQNKLHDISTIYDAYTRFKGDYMDNEDIINMIIEKIPQSKLLKNSKVYIDHFDVFTFQGYNMIEQIAKVASDVTVALCMDSDKKQKDSSSLFDLTRNTLAKLKEKLDNLNIKPIKREDSNAILDFANNIFENNPKALTKTNDSIELFKFSDALYEVSFVTSKVIDLKSKGYTFRDIAILTTEDNFTVLEQSFVDNKIPYYIDKKTPLMTNRLAKFIIYALKNCHYVDVPNYISMLKQSVMPVTDEGIFLFENYLLAKGYKKAFSNTADDENILVIAKRVSIDKFKNKIAKCETIQDYCNKTLDYFTGFDIVFNDDTEEKAFNAICETLTNMAEIFSDTQSTLAEFIDMLTVGFNSIDIKTVPPQNDAVLIGDISRTKLHNSKCLFIMSALDGTIPKVTVKSGIITEYDNSQLQSNGVKLGRDTNDLNSLEKILTYKAMANPSDYLCISYAVRNLGGRENFPSPIFKKAEDIFGEGFKIESNLPFNQKIELTLLNSKQIALKNLIYQCKQKDLSPVFRSTYDFFNEDNFMDNLLNPKDIDMSITKKQAKELYPNHISASRIERYFECAFKHFIAYGLKPEPRQMYEINKLDTGSLMHEILEKFTNMVLDQSFTAMDDMQINKIVDDIVKATVKEDDVLHKDKIGEAMIARVTNIVQRALHKVKRNLEKTGFDLRYTELEIGGTKVDPYIVETDGIKLPFRGVIDRVDIDHRTGNIRVIDYKTSTADFDFAKVYHGLKTQLFIYMDVLLKTFAKSSMNNPIPYEMAYMKLNIETPQEKKDKSIDERKEAVKENYGDLKSLSLKDIDPEKYGTNNIDIFKNIIGFGDYKAKQAVKNIYNGDIQINPYFKKQDDNACTYCEYKNICKNVDKKVKLKTMKKDEFIERTKDGME